MNVLCIHAGNSKIFRLCRFKRLYNIAVLFLFVVAQVKVLSMKNGLIEYDDVQFIKIVSKDYNLLIMQDYLPIIGELDGSIDIKGEDINLSFPKIKAFYMNSNNVFNLMVKEDD